MLQGIDEVCLLTHQWPKNFDSILKVETKKIRNEKRPKRKKGRNEKKAETKKEQNEKRSKRKKIRLNFEGRNEKKDETGLNPSLRFPFFIHPLKFLSY